MVETTYDLRYNIAAIMIAICSDKYLLPEKAFSIIEEKYYRLGEDDVEDMLALKAQGITYRKISEIYGISDSAAFHAIRRYKEKKEEPSDGNLKAQG